MELLLPLILLVPLLMITFRARKQQRTFAELQSRVAPGQSVVTTAGLHGTVASVQDDIVMLEVAEGLQLRWSKAAIGQIVDTPATDGYLDADSDAEPVADELNADDARPEHRSDTRDES